MKPAAQQQIRRPSRGIQPVGGKKASSADRSVAIAASTTSARADASATTFQTRNIDEARQHMGIVFRSHDLRLARTGKLQMQHESLRLGRLSAHWLAYGGGVTMSAPEMDRFYLFQFNLQGGCNVTHGSETIMVGGANCYAINPNRPLSKIWDEDCSQLILRIDRNELDEFATREIGLNAAGRLAFDFRAIPMVGGFGDIIGAIKAQREADVDGFAHFRVARHLEATLMSLLLANFPHSLRREFDRAAQPCAPYYVRRAEQYIYSHARDAVGIDELVAAAGVSSRSLFAGFKRFRDTTPMAYVRDVRLDLALADLASADAAHATVTDIAINCGFTHMGRFARDFKARYGETPAKMLGRRRIC